jgi:hypothetical protein
MANLHPQIRAAVCSSEPDPARTAGDDSHPPAGAAGAQRVTHAGLCYTDCVRALDSRD